MSLDQIYRARRRHPILVAILATALLLAISFGVGTLANIVVLPEEQVPWIGDILLGGIAIGLLTMLVVIVDSLLDEWL
jgi:hypothetical protein